MFKGLIGLFEKFGCWGLFMIPFALAGIFIVGLSVQEFMDYRELDQSGIITQGRMTDRNISTSDDSTSYYIHYEFYHNDKLYSAQQTVTENEYDNYYEFGRRVDILYAPDNPDNSSFADKNSISEPIFLCIFGICWNAFILLIIGLGIRNG